MCGMCWSLNALSYGKPHQVQGKARMSSETNWSLILPYMGVGDPLKPQGRTVQIKSVFMTNQPQIPKNPINACSFLSVGSLNPQVPSLCSTSSRSDDNLCLLVCVQFQVFIIMETNSSEPATTISPNRLSGYWIKLNNAMGLLWCTLCYGESNQGCTSLLYAQRLGMAPSLFQCGQKLEDYKRVQFPAKGGSPII